MAIILKSVKYLEIVIDSNNIIGVMGDDYQVFLKSIQGDDVYNFILENFNNCKKVSDYISDKYLKDFDLNKDFLDKKIASLSHSEERILKYLVMLDKDVKVIIIDEPFLDLDYHYKKLVIALFNSLIKYKTIIIGSMNSNIIYEVCKKVLLLGKDSYLYKDSIILANKNVLKRYHLTMPEIIAFVREVNAKKNHLSYTNDIRDLIKDVYRNVTKQKN